MSRAVTGVAVSAFVSAALAAVVACVPPVSYDPYPGACAELTTCCKSVPASEQPSCDTVASSGDDASCYGDLVSFQASLMCPAGDGGVVDAGSPVAGNTSCVALVECCPLLSPADQAVCNQIAGGGVESSCLTLLGEDGCASAPTISLPTSAAPIPPTFFSESLPISCTGDTFVLEMSALCPVSATWFLCNAGTFSAYDCEPPGAGWTEVNAAGDAG